MITIGAAGRYPAARVFPGWQVSLGGDVTQDPVLLTGSCCWRARSGSVDTAFFARRKVPYQRQHLQLVSPQRAADAIVDAVVCVIPSWLSLPARLKANFPSLYRLLAARFAPQAAR